MHVNAISIIHFGFVFIGKIVKIVPHLYHYPEDLRFLPVHCLFGYLHGLIKMYALFTIFTTAYERRTISTVSAEKEPLLKSTGETRSIEKLEIEEEQEHFKTDR